GPGARARPGRIENPSALTCVLAGESAPKRPRRVLARPAAARPTAALHGPAGNTAHSRHPRLSPSDRTGLAASLAFLGTASRCVDAVRPSSDSRVVSANKAEGAEQRPR